MGPKVRAFLGIDDAQYQGAEAQASDGASAVAFSTFLVEAARTKGLTSPDDLTDLLDELVTMDLPEAVLGLAAAHSDLVLPDDFRAQLAIGVAAMLAGDVDEAETRFRTAQALLPDEPAPYVNLGQIMLAENRLAEAETWVVAGLDAEPNNFRLWDLLAEIFRERHGEYTPDELLAVAEKRNAWAGLALAANLTTTGDRYLKLSLLERPYHQGERDPEFLVELTAAMGIAGEYERIPPVVWQAERSSKKALPWQLHVHVAQAHLALNKQDLALEALAKAKADKALPPEVQEALTELEAEAKELPH